MTTLLDSALARSFAEDFGGTLITGTDPQYDRARALWNGTVDRHPALIAQCRGPEDIAAAVTFAREAELCVAVRGGGHSVAGFSMCDDGLVVDLTLMRHVAVDPVRRVAAVQPGATWRDFDAATAEHGLASTGGLISSTGVAGLTLGGGIGWLQRRYGLACDNLVAADLVTADGGVVHASEAERSEVLWALRGGGGNLGVVAQFEFTLHEVSTILGGLMLFPFERGRQVLRAFRDWARDLPDAGTMLAAVMTAPPEPFVPAALQGHPVVAIVGCWCGDLEEGAVALQPLRRLEPAVDLFGPMPYAALQQMLDAGAPAGLRSYFRGGFVADLDDDVIEVVLDHGARMPSPMSAIHLHQMGGAVARVGVDDTAFSGRSAGYTYNVVSTWADPTEDAVHLKANRELTEALAPVSTGGAYVNFVPETAGEGEGRSRAAYGDDIYDRLARLKREFDPTNLFRSNHNVRPAR